MTCLRALLSLTLVATLHAQSTVDSTATPSLQMLAPLLTQMHNEPLCATAHV